MRDAFIKRPDDYNGRTIASIANEFGVSRRLVRENCNRCGITFFKMTGKQYAARDKFYDWLAKNEGRIQSLSISQIAREAEISVKTASKCYRTLDVARPKRAGRPPLPKSCSRTSPLNSKRYEWEFKEYCEIAAKKWREGDNNVDLTRRRGRRRLEEDEEEDNERFAPHGYI